MRGKEALLLVSRRTINWARNEYGAWYAGMAAVKCEKRCSCPSCWWRGVEAPSSIQVANPTRAVILCRNKGVAWPYVVRWPAVANNAEILLFHGMGMPLHFMPAHK